VNAPLSLPGWRDRLGTLLLSVCAVGAIVSAVSAVATVSSAGEATEAVETWRLVGFAFFAGIAGWTAPRAHRWPLAGRGRGRAEPPTRPWQIYTCG